MLFGVGAYQAVTLVGDWRRKGLQMVLIGLGAAAVGFLIGRLFHTTRGMTRSRRHPPGCARQCARRSSGGQGRKVPTMG